MSAFTSHSVEESEKPQRYLVPETDFDVVVHDKTVRDVLDLLEPLPLAPDLEEKFPVNEKITGSGKDHFVILPQLIEEM